MSVSHIPLLKNKLQFFYLISTFLIIFIINILLEYKNFNHFKQDDIYVTKATILNIYPKDNYTIIKCQNNLFTFFTSIQNKYPLQINDSINIYLITAKVSFIDFLKGFYTTSFNVEPSMQTNNIKKILSKKIEIQHHDKTISQLFKALFLAQPINKDLRTLCSSFGISHLIAISGFHLGILSFMLYWILYLPYNIIHQKYFPYRNKKFDILIVVSTILFLYLSLTNFVPSLFRAFMMFVVAIYLLRSNIKLISFATLFLVTLSIISFSPKLLFSLSLWFSVAGVFYIFLLLQYSQHINKIVLFLIFNIFIFVALNPIIHFFFCTVSIYQLYSPLITICFSIFYPLELFLHIIGYGALLDPLIQIWLKLHLVSYNILTPTWILIGYLIVSFLAIFSIRWFFVLITTATIFNLWLYGQFYL